MSRALALAGAFAGALAATVAFAPAGWLAGGVGRLTEGRLLLADARGTVWSGSAVPVLTGGAGSRDASALGGRLEWSFGLAQGALVLALRQACCIDPPLTLRLEPAWPGLRVVLPPSSGPLARWPAGLLVGLGTPWNTLQPGGELRLSTPGLSVGWLQGRWRVDGRAQVDVVDASSRLATLPRLGSYRVVLQGDAASGAASVTVSTLEGPLQFTGSGQWAGARLRLRGEARAEPGSEPALGNLLNIVGRRQGPVSVISIG